MNNQPWGKGHKVRILYYGSEGNKNSGFESFDFLKGIEFEKEYLCVSNIFSYVYFSQNSKIVSRWCNLMLRKKYSYRKSNAYTLTFVILFPKMVKITFTEEKAIYS